MIRKGSCVGLVNIRVLKGSTWSDYETISISYEALNTSGHCSLKVFSCMSLTFMMCLKMQTIRMSHLHGCIFTCAVVIICFRLNLRVIPNYFESCCFLDVRVAKCIYSFVISYIIFQNYKTIFSPKFLKTTIIKQCNLISCIPGDKV